MLREGQVCTVTAEGWSSEGDAVARIDGQAVFLHGALPGERCRVVIRHVGHRAAWADLEELLEAAPGRQAPDCPYYARCGGCQTRHMDYALELAFKADKVRAALGHIGGLEVGEVPIYGAAHPCRYRNKVQFPLAPGPRMGYYRQRSHQVIDVDDCLLTPALCAPVRGAVLAWMERFHVPAYREADHTGLVRHLYVRTDRAGEALVCLVVNGRTLPHEGELVAALTGLEGVRIRGIVLSENTKPGNVVLGSRYRTLWGEDHLLDTLRGLTFKLSVPSFYQVHRDQAEVLYGLVRDFAALTGGERVVDLYCGAGTIGLTLARQAGELIGVEIVPQAIDDARENARRNGIGNARFLCADAKDFAAQAVREGVRPDVLIVDPPRKGLAPQVVESVLALAPRRLVYVSCDPATLARDVKLLSPAYRLDRLAAVDMFPRTAHVETVALLVGGTEAGGGERP